MRIFFGYLSVVFFEFEVFAKVVPEVVEPRNGSVRAGSINRIVVAVARKKKIKCENLKRQKQEKIFKTQDELYQVSHLNTNSRFFG